MLSFASIDPLLECLSSLLWTTTKIVAPLILATVVLLLLSRCLFIALKKKTNYYRVHRIEFINMGLRLFIIIGFMRFRLFPSRICIIWLFIGILSCCSWHFVVCIICRLFPLLFLFVRKIMPVVMHVYCRDNACLLYARVLGFLLSYLKILWLFWIYLRCDYSVMQKSASIERGAFSPFRWHKHSAIRCNKMLQFQSFWFSKFLWKFAAIGATFIWESSLYIGEIDGHMKNLPYISFKRNN